jgi:Flp pilus assembly protein TadG
MTPVENEPQLRDRGTGGVEVAFSVTALLLVAFFIIGALRVTNSGGDVQAAARAGARAAAVARTAGEGQSMAYSVVQSALSDRGVACNGGPRVSASRGGGLATVSVTCVVALGDVSPAGFKRTRSVSASASERVDPIRGGDSG